MFLKNKIVWIRRMLVLLMCLLILCGCDLKKAEQPSSKGFEIVFFSIGEADCALIKCDGHYAMIDCGSDKSSNGASPSYYLEQEGVKKLDYIFCSHYDSDHYEGFNRFLRKYSVGSFYGPTVTDDVNAKAFNELTDILNKKFKRIKTPKVGDEFELGEAKIEVLGVDIGKTDSTPALRKNNSSLVLMVTYGKTGFLFTGDIEESAENALIKSGVNLKCNVLKVSHHGSDTSTKTGFLDKAKPIYAILTVSENANKPYSAVIDRLEEKGITIYRTDSGMIKVTSNKNEVTISTQSITSGN